MYFAMVTFTDQHSGLESATADFGSEWSAELFAVADDLALENGLTIQGRSTSVGLWKGQSEPSVSVDVIADTYQDITEFARALAVEYDQEAVMVVDAGSSGTMNHAEIAMDVKGLTHSEIFARMEAKGLDGGTIEGDNLVILADSDSFKAACELANELGHVDARMTWVEFVTQDR